MAIPTLSSPRLFLRPWRPEDAEALHRILQEPGILDYFPPTSFTLDKVQHYIAHQLAHWQERGYGHWAIVSRGDDQVIGWNGLEYLPELDGSEVAYLLSRSVWGKGFASEAARLAVRFGFEEAGLQNIIGLVHPENAASIRVLEKCGLTLSDRLHLWGIDMLRYRIERSVFLDLHQNHRI